MSGYLLIWYLLIIIDHLYSWCGILVQSVYEISITRLFIIPTIFTRLLIAGDDFFPLGKNVGTYVLFIVVYTYRQIAEFLQWYHWCIFSPSYHSQWHRILFIVSILGPKAVSQQQWAFNSDPMNIIHTYLPRVSSDAWGWDVGSNMVGLVGPSISWPFLQSLPSDWSCILRRLWNSPWC